MRVMPTEAGWSRPQFGEKRRVAGNHVNRAVAATAPPTPCQEALMIAFALFGAAALAVALLSGGRDLDFAGRQTAEQYRRR